MTNRTSTDATAETFILDDSAPDDVAGSNQVRVLHSDVLFEQVDL